MCFLIALGVLLPSVVLVRNFLGNFLGSVPEILEKNFEDHDQGDVQDRVGREEGTEIEDECDCLRCGLQYEACES